VVPGYEVLGPNEIEINRLMIRNVDPDTPIKVKYLRFKNQNRDLITHLKGHFYSETDDFRDAEEIIVAPLGSVSFGTARDAEPLFSYMSERDQGRALFIVGWEANERVMKPQVGAIVSAFSTNREKERSLLALCARWKQY
jgi:hypothetical protein